MACYNKVGTMLRPSISALTALSGQSSMLNAIRMSTRLFVGGLSYGIDDQYLKDAFSSFGEVESARVVTDLDSGKSRGFGFVSFLSDECATSALSAMDGQELHGRSIRVSYAKMIAPRRSYGNGGFGNRGANHGFY